MQAAQSEPVTTSINKHCISCEDRACWACNVVHVQFKSTGDRARLDLAGGGNPIRSNPVAMSSDLRDPPSLAKYPEDAAVRHTTSSDAGANAGVDAAVTRIVLDAADKTAALLRTQPKP